MDLRLFVGNSNVVELRELRNAVTDARIVAATVEFTLLDEAGNEVPGTAWPVAMPFDVSDNVYRAVLPIAVAIVEGEYYFARVDAVGPGQEVFSAELGLSAVRRRRA